MAPRAYWKGYLKLSLVSCPIALFSATSERDKISFGEPLLLPFLCDFPYAIQRL
jgi:hypothetical protein